MSNKYTTLSGGLGAASITVAALCLATSVFQAGVFIDGVMGQGIHRNIMIGGIVSCLLGSQVLARLVGQALKAKAATWAVLIGVLSIGIIEFLSIGISTLSFDGNLLQSSREANMSSPQYAQTQENIQFYKQQIASLQAQSDGLPSDWISRRNEIAEKIMSLHTQIKVEQRNANTVNVAIADQAFSRLEASTGITQERVSLIMGVLLSIVPMAINLLAGSLGWTAEPKKKATTGKKSQSRLRAVAA